MRKLLARSEVNRAIHKGLKFLRNHQDSNGGFTDFSSTGMSSQDWVTAHICWVLEEVPDFGDMGLKGAKFLLSRMKQDGSWGFNERVSGDSGTTAQSLMVLKGRGLEVFPKTLDWILRQQANDGGFRTYPYSSRMPINHWSETHPETTLYVLGALTRLGIAPRERKSALHWYTALAKFGSPAAFWWGNPAYLLWVQKKVGVLLKGAVSLSYQELTELKLEVPDLPMFLYGMRRAGESDSTLRIAVEGLLTLQKADGSWPCGPCLKVPTLKISLQRESTPTFCGNQRVFSTAHSIAALFDLCCAQV